jgi:D-glycero-alpha-D-manno-heptose-7-phosphate kinase
VRLQASAPTRIDLAGGTLDIWPLYLFHPGAQTLNAAISIRARCALAPRPDRRLRLRSEDTGAELEIDDWRAAPDRGELKLLGLLVRHFRPEGLDLVTRSESPVGAGIAGSSAMTIAVAGALARWTGRTLSSDELLTVAMNVEAQTIEVPTGVQDYRPALYGGISAVELGVEGVRRVRLDVPAAELERRIVLAYTRASRNSGINNWEVTKRHIDGDAEVIANFRRIAEIAGRMRDALARADWDGVAREIAAEWENRKRLAPGVTTATIDALIDRARDAGALAAKVCGAGGGGCLFCFCDPSRAGAVAGALASGGATTLGFHVEEQGLRIEEAAE